MLRKLKWKEENLKCLDRQPGSEGYHHLCGSSCVALNITCEDKCHEGYSKYF